MIQIKFEPHEKSKYIRGLWQYDYGRTLQISGLDLPEQVKIEFSLHDRIGETTPRTGITTEGITEVQIPNTLLANEGCRSEYCIYVFIYIEDEETGFTYRKIILSVQARPKPGNYNVPDEKPDYLITQTKQNTEDIQKLKEEMITEEVLTEKVVEALTEAKESGDFGSGEDTSWMNEPVLSITIEEECASLYFDSINGEPFEFEEMAGRFELQGITTSSEGRLSFAPKLINAAYLGLLVANTNGRESAIQKGVFFIKKDGVHGWYTEHTSNISVEWTNGRDTVGRHVSFMQPNDKARPFKDVTGGIKEFSLVTYGGTFHVGSVIEFYGKPVKKEVNV